MNIDTATSASDTSREKTGAPSKLAIVFIALFMLSLISVLEAQNFDEWTHY